MSASIVQLLSSESSAPKLGPLIAITSLSCQVIVPQNIVLNDKQINGDGNIYLQCQNQTCFYDFFNLPLYSFYFKRFPDYILFFPLMKV